MEEGASEHTDKSGDGLAAVNGGKGETVEEGKEKTQQILVSDRNVSNDHRDPPLPCVVLEDNRLGSGGGVIRDSKTVEERNGDHQQPNPTRIVAEDAEGLVFIQNSSSVEGKKKPSRLGVILLGRGNSFSLGRSEVILLHNKRRSRHNADTNNASDISQGHRVNQSVPTIKGRENDDNRLNCISEQSTDVADDDVNTPSSPPPISNISISPDSALINGWLGSRAAEDRLASPPPVECPAPATVAPAAVDFWSHDLDQLWLKVEATMSVHKARVLKVLEEFGIGEPGGGGGDEGGHDDNDWEERVQEEEEMWHIVQDDGLNGEC